MKHQACLFLIIASVLLSACTKDPVEPLPNNGEKVLYLKDKDLSTIRLRNVPGIIYLHSPVKRGEVIIEGNQNLNDVLIIKSENGELVFEAGSNVPQPLDVKFYINPLDAYKIIVEGNSNFAIRSSVVVDSLELITQGESRLSWSGLQANKLITKRDGKSKMVLSSEMMPVVQTRLSYPLMQVLVLDSNHLIYHEGGNRYVLYAPEIVTTQDSAIAIRSTSAPLRSFFLITEHTLRNEGESDLDARYLPTITVFSKNESKSTSLVWATGQLDVHGEGESLMYYFGSPRITKVLNGSAQLLPF